MGDSAIPSLLEQTFQGAFEKLADSAEAEMTTTELVLWLRWVHTWTGVMGPHMARVEPEEPRS